MNMRYKMDNIAKTQQTLDQIAENNKHIKRNYDDTIEVISKIGKCAAR